MSLEEDLLDDEPEDDDLLELLEDELLEDELLELADLLFESLSEELLELALFVLLESDLLVNWLHDTKAMRQRIAAIEMTNSFETGCVACSFCA